MVLINVAQREISCKIVYYGPGLCGKTTNIQVVHDRAPAEHKGKLTSLATEGDRTLFFDFLPLDLGTIGGMRTKFQLYTVPGQVFYNATRKLVLRGADGVIFVADSSADKMKENIESLENLISNLKEQGMDINDIPLVFQWNKRDLPNAVPEEELQRTLNRWNAPAFPAVAIKGEGVFATLKAISEMVLDKISRKIPQRAATPVAASPSRPAAPTPAPAPPAGARPLVATGPAPSAAPSTRPAAVPAQAAARSAPSPPPKPSPAPKPVPAARPVTAAPARKVQVVPATPQPVAPEKPPTSALDPRVSWAIFGVIVAVLVGAILYLLLFQ